MRRLDEKVHKGKSDGTERPKKRDKDRKKKETTNFLIISTIANSFEMIKNY